MTFVQLAAMWAPSIGKEFTERPASISQAQAESPGQQTETGHVENDDVPTLVCRLDYLYGLGSACDLAADSEQRRSDICRGLRRIHGQSGAETMDIAAINGTAEPVASGLSPAIRVRCIFYDACACSGAIRLQHPFVGPQALAVEARLPLPAYLAAQLARPMAAVHEQASAQGSSEHSAVAPPGWNPIWPLLYLQVLSANVSDLQLASGRDDTRRSGPHGRPGGCSTPVVLASCSADVSRLLDGHIAHPCLTLDGLGGRIEATVKIERHRR